MKQVELAADVAYDVTNTVLVQIKEIEGPSGYVIGHALIFSNGARLNAYSDPDFQVIASTTINSQS